MADISDLPMLHDIDADYTPQYIKLARIIRDKIETGEHKHLDALPASDLAGDYRVSPRVAYAALAMLAANRYVARPPGFRSYRVTWQAQQCFLASPLPEALCGLPLPSSWPRHEPLHLKPFACSIRLR